MGENGDKNGVRPQNKNLKPFKKGENGGAHRPKGQRNYSTLRELAIIELAKKNNKTAEEIEIEIMANAILEARKGNFQFYKDDKDRVYGSAINKSTLEVTLPKPITDVFIQNSDSNEKDSTTPQEN